MFITVLIPAYNEEGNVIPAVERTFKTLTENGLDGEIVLIDDGSRDKTWEEIQQILPQFPSLRVFQHSRNRGLSAALTTGFKYMRGDIVIFIPADLEYIPEEVIPCMVAKFGEGYDVVVGYKVNDHYQGVRLIASPLNDWLLRHLFHVPVRHMNATRAFRREVVQDMNLRSEWHSLMIAIAAARGWRIGEVPVTIYPRTRGISKFGARTYLFALFDLITLRLLLTFEGRPMTLFGLVAFILFGLSFAGVVYMILDLLRRPVDFFRPMLIISGSAFLAGVMFLLIGFLAEMIVNQSSQLREQREQIAALQEELKLQHQILEAGRDECSNTH